MRQVIDFNKTSYLVMVDGVPTYAFADLEEAEKQLSYVRFESIYNDLSDCDEPDEYELEAAVDQYENLSNKPYIEPVNFNRLMQTRTVALSGGKSMTIAQLLKLERKTGGEAYCEYA